MSNSASGSDIHCSEGSSEDPVTVLIQPLSCKFKNLKVNEDPNEPTTPTSDSTMSGLNRSLREFLDEQLGTFAQEPRVYIKMLVPHAAAGGIIGKGGCHISAIQSKTSAKIQLSKLSESLPMTNERIILITGMLKQVVPALDLIINKIIHEQALLIQHHRQNYLSKQDSTGFVSPPTPLASSGGRGCESTSEKSGATSVCSLPFSDTTTTTTTTTTAAAAAAPGYASETKFKLKLLVPNALIEAMQGKHKQHLMAAQNTHNVIVNVHHSPSQLSPLHHKMTVITGEPSDVIKAATCLTLQQTDHSRYLYHCDLPIPPPSSSLSALPENDDDDMNLQSYYYHQEQLNYYNNNYYYYYYQQQQQQQQAAGGNSATGGYFSVGGYGVDEATAWAMQQQQQQYAYYYDNMYSSYAPVMAAAPVSSPHTTTSPSSSSSKLEAEVLMTMTESQSIAVLGQQGCRLEDLQRAANVYIVVMGLTNAKTKKKGAGYKLRQLQIRGGHANVQYAQQLIGQRLMECGAEVEEIEREKERRMMEGQQQQQQQQQQQRYKKRSNRGGPAVEGGDGTQLL